MTAAILWTTAFLMWLYFITLHKSYWIDTTRQRLFAIRDELFDKANNDDLPFDSDAYRLMRNTLNGMIHYTHDISVTAAIIRPAMAPLTGLSADGLRYETAYARALQKLSLPGQEAIQNARRRMHLVLVIHLVHTSALLWVSLVPLINIAKAARMAERLSRFASTPRLEWRPIDATAYCIGSRNSNAHC